VPAQIEIELGMTFELRGEIIVTGYGCISRFLRRECEPAITVTLSNLGSSPSRCGLGNEATTSSGQTGRTHYKTTHQDGASRLARPVLVGLGVGDRVGEGPPGKRPVG
jgi:hypothetical protein